MSRRIVSQTRAAQQLVGLSSRAPRPRDLLLTIALLKDYLQAGHPQASQHLCRDRLVRMVAGRVDDGTELCARRIELEAEHGLAELIVSAVNMGCLPRWLTETERSSI